MNAVEIEQAISDLALQPFDAANFPYAFLTAFGNKEVTLKRLRSGNNNTSDLSGGVLLRNNIHIATCEAGNVSETFTALLTSAATAKGKAKFVLATDGQTLEAQELANGETIACEFEDFPNHFGFLLPLAGISTIKEIKDNPIDVRATGRLNKLYVELLRENPAWAKDERRSDMNHFMARLVFCFFAEDTGIFSATGLFTRTVDRWSERSASNTHEVLSEIFRAMNIKSSDQATVMPRLPAWASAFPYVNGGLFSGSTEVPHFTQMARTYLLHAGSLNWREINPDIFGSMIQAVADDEERGALGMHYTSVPNILKVLNPLFLDDLRAALAEAGNNERKLLNLRKRMARIRVFDPACGSGNFLVIAYKQLRAIEAEINRRRGETDLGSAIPLTNFRGIELRSFPAEIARLALIIAEFQCDVLYRGQKDALAEFLPLDAQNWIVCGNALRLDWLSICPPTGTGVKLAADDLFSTPLDQAQIDFENEGGETYIFGNPPYLGARWQADVQKDDMQALFAHRCKNWKSLDYVSGWFIKASDYMEHGMARAAFVTTNSACQGVQVPTLWSMLFSAGCEIFFAHTSFKWQNLASKNAGVTVAIVGFGKNIRGVRHLFSVTDDGNSIVKVAENINGYLTAGSNIEVQKASSPMGPLAEMTFGNTPIDGGHLLLDTQELLALGLSDDQASRLTRRIYGSSEFIRGTPRHCLWISDSAIAEAMSIPAVRKRVELVKESRLKGGTTAREIASRPHQFQRMNEGQFHTIVVPGVSSENRPFLPVGLIEPGSVPSNKCFALYDAPLWNMALIASRLHWIWIGTVCVRLEMRFSYSNTLGWNTFPVPLLTEQNKVDLTRCAEDILLAREAHFPATIADLYDPETMPDNLRHAHERNDEVLERIYIGRRFKNDTERLEKLFELYTKMTAAEKSKLPATAVKRRKKTS
ncbi:class I SAM-dependent DNA methyltransferase [Duganella vulcania]|uniref:site-specific DNA-methyltransferase (adenine-specific) n=1 Tax=Duganella vulcania TaxID=2692166 RepID=A0A845GDG1_9BURK|nr:class I SAM-dependent DNA methyltransferase [Duganella vulcania]MYM92304.1 lactate dehydrogenase [Duganella vulcania]